MDKNSILQTLDLIDVKIRVIKDLLNSLRKECEL